MTMALSLKTSLALHNAIMVHHDGPSTNDTAQLPTKDKLEEGLFSAKLKDDDLADGSGLPEGAPKDASPLL